MSVTWPDGAAVQGDAGESYFRTLVQHAADIITILDADGIVRYESPALQQVLGYHPDELVGTDPFALIHPDDAPAIRDRFQEVVRHEGMSTSARFRFRHKDGSWHWLEVIGTNLLGDPGVRGVVVNSRDVTERQRQAQERDLLDEVRTALARELELPDLFRTVVEATARTFGYTLVSLYLLEGRVLVLQYQVGYDHVAQRIPVTEGVSGRVVRTGEAVLLVDVRTDPAFIGTIPGPGIISEVCVPLSDQDDVVGTFNLESRDGVYLTDADLRLMVALSEHVNVAIGRARLYTAVRRSEARFRALVQQAADIIIVLDADGTRKYISPSVERVLGYRPEELIGGSLSDLRHPDDQTRARDIYLDVMAHPG
ncbi:MAG: PAS domain S-box protein, partial [Chloroflexia bacterium]|nr:PAS domain S-box protein [Chloroflexia bacterium]